MNSIFTLALGLMSSFFPQNHTPRSNLDQTYTCAALDWTTPATMGSDGHLRGVASVTCSFTGLSGGGYPELEAYLLAQFNKQATHVYSGPKAGDYENLPSTTYDFDMAMTFSGKPATARELGTIASDSKTKLLSLMKTESITGTSYDSYIKGFDLYLDVESVDPAPRSYQGALSVSIDMTKPWYAPTSVFINDVVNDVQNAVTNYRDTVITELQNNL